MTRIKLCGMYRPEDGEMVGRVKPDYFGMVINFPRSHRNVTPVQAAALRDIVPKEIPAVGVFVNRPAGEIGALLEKGVIQIAQLHGDESEEDILALRHATGKPVWKAFRVRSSKDLERAEKSPADLILLDNGYGTGQPFDWSLIHGTGRPFALAGGLTPENLGEAVRRFAPVLVDLSSGIEINRKKDENRARMAVEAVRGFEREPGK